jgi:hypothetical protein
MTFFGRFRVSDGIHCLVFSKDRAMQLDAFLRSAKQHAPYASVTVLWNASDQEHADTYEWDLWRSQMFAREHGGKDFEKMFRLWLADFDRVVFHTDDDVFFPQHDPLIPSSVETTDNIISLRLGANTTHCHPMRQTQRVPEIINSSLRWQWREEEGDFGYPLTLNATVYRSADLLPLLDFPFSNPTELEAGLAAQADRFGPQWMTAPLRSCCVSLPHNRVSVSSGCPAGSNPAWQPDALRDLYLEGWRIDLDAMDFSAVVGAHQEIPLRFYKPGRLDSAKNVR